MDSKLNLVLCLVSLQLLSWHRTVAHKGFITATDQKMPRRFHSISPSRFINFWISCFLKAKDSSWHLCPWSQLLVPHGHSQELKDKIHDKMSSVAGGLWFLFLVSKPATVSHDWLSSSGFIFCLVRFYFPLEILLITKWIQGKYWLTDVWFSCVVFCRQPNKIATLLFQFLILWKLHLI